MQNTRLQETMNFIREKRGNEENFEALHQRLKEDATEPGSNEEYRKSLEEIGEKWAAEYRTRKEGGGSAWPEFEKFVSELEKAVLNATKSAG